MKIKLLLVLTLVFFQHCGGKPIPILGHDGKSLRGSVSKLEEWKIGGIGQFVSIRGMNESSPVLLVLHGGPGASAMPLFRHYQNPLENHFLVINWDQRNSGKTYTRNGKDEKLTLVQLESDLSEMVDTILKKFNRKKIFLLGHSFGTWLGLKYAIKSSDKLYAYIGAGQIVNIAMAEEMAYKFTLDEAEKSGDAKSLKVLKEIGKPNSGIYKNSEKSLLKQREILLKYGGGFKKERDYNHFVEIFKKAPEYTLMDLINYESASESSLKAVWADYAKTDFLNLDTSGSKIYFFSGIGDRVAPVELVSKLANKIGVPDERHILFPNSSHWVWTEEPEYFQKEMLRILKTYQDAK